MKKVKIFTADNCSHCEQAINYLKTNSVDFEEIDLTSDKEAAANLVKETGYSMLPQIKIDDDYIVGFDKEKLEEILKD